MNVDQEDASVLNAVLHMAANAGANAADARTYQRQLETWALQNYPEIVNDRGLAVVAVDRLRQIAEHDRLTGNQRSDFDRMKEAGDYVRQRYSMATQAAPSPQPRAQDAPRPIRETASRSNRPESASVPMDAESILERNRKEAVAKLAAGRGKEVGHGDNPMPSYIDS